MGGEPTFVSIDDYQAAEWNTARSARPSASAPTNLIRRLRDRFAPGGFLHYGQGKWYPGETLPRWAFALLLAQGRRADLAQRRSDRAPNSRRARATTEDAQRFAEGVAERLGLATEYVLPAYEDPADRMLKEGELPDNVDPSRSQDRRPA